MLRREDVPIRVPCEEAWDAMADHGRYRMCARCAQPVHDLKQYTEREVLALVAAGACKRVSLYDDGTVATEDEVVIPPSRLTRFARAAALVVPLAACTASPAVDDTGRPVAATPAGSSIPAWTPRPAETAAPSGSAPARPGPSAETAFSGSPLSSASVPVPVPAAPGSRAPGTPEAAASASVTVPAPAACAPRNLAKGKSRRKIVEEMGGY